MFLEEISKMMLVTVQSNDYVKNIAIFGLVFVFVLLEIIAKLKRVAYRAGF